MVNLLFTSISFPPKSDPECLQAAKYFYYLQQYSDFRIEVLTSAMPTLFMPEDKNLRRYDQGYSNKVELRLPENRYWNYIKRKFFREGIDWPDSKKRFHLKWKQAVRQIRQKPDVIYSRSFPLSSSVMALRLKQYYDIPWVMHLSDPWVDSPIHIYSKKQYDYHKSLERECISFANYVSFTSELTVELYEERYPEYKKKFLYFPNVYDEQDIEENPHRFGSKIKVVYTGGLTGPRNISPLLYSLEILKQEEPNLLDMFEFIFAGDMDRRNRNIFDRHSFKNIKHVGLLSYNEALDLQRSADILLVIDNPIEDPRKAVFFPSKVLDYLLAQRKIMGISTIGGSTEKMLSTIDCKTFSHQDGKGLANEFKAIAGAYSRKDGDYFLMKELPVKYSASYNTSRLKELIIDLIK